MQNTKKLKLGTKLRVYSNNSEQEHNIVIITTAPYVFTFLDLDEWSRLSDRAAFVVDGSSAQDMDTIARNALTRINCDIIEID